MDFIQGGTPKTPLEVRGDAPDGRTGTTVRFWPVPSIVDDIIFRNRGTARYEDQNGAHLGMTADRLVQLIGG